MTDLTREGLATRVLINGDNPQNRLLIDRWADIARMQVQHTVACIMADAHQRVYEIYGHAEPYFLRAAAATIRKGEKP